jgi:beta-phosphoglucomutase-like phosphatase (HAD superfamily)
MKKYILFDHDGVLVDTESWYFRAGQRALADIGFTLDPDQYLRDYENSNPHPEPYLTGLKRFGATGEESLVVEDSARGLAPAVAAGIECAVVHNEFTRTRDFSSATHRIKTPTELKDIIRAPAG